MSAFGLEEVPRASLDVEGIARMGDSFQFQCLGQQNEVRGAWDAIQMRLPCTSPKHLLHKGTLCSIMYSRRS